MSVIVINPNGDIIGSGISAVRGDFQGEKGLIKVTVGPGETDFFYIGTNDRDSYTFETVDLPDGFEASKYTFKDSVLIAK